MFIQVIRGKVSDAQAMREAADRWNAELKPGATGFLGATQGIAADGTFVTVARFESEAAAQANSERPEHGAWWKNTSTLFDPGATFYDCPRVEASMGGGSDEAGFVQLMIYNPSDADAALAMGEEFEKLGAMRPDIIGGTTAVATDGTFIDTNYFTSEAEARAAEKQPMMRDVQALMDRFAAIAGPVEFIDLSDPWLVSA